jgi:hypothetical protein
MKPILFLMLLSVLSLGCSKKDETLCVAGEGGSCDLILFPQHHDDPILSQENYLDSVFIKFNTKEFPGDDKSKYDLIIVGNVGDDNILVKGLKCGNYFIYMTGYDQSISERVKGGIPYYISEDFSGVKNVVVPVTED